MRGGREREEGEGEEGGREGGRRERKGGLNQTSNRTPSPGGSGTVTQTCTLSPHYSSPLITLINTYTLSLLTPSPAAPPPHSLLTPSHFHTPTLYLQRSLSPTHSASLSPHTLPPSHPHLQLPPHTHSPPHTFTTPHTLPAGSLSPTHSTSLSPHTLPPSHPHLQSLEHRLLVFLDGISCGTGGGQTTHALQSQVPARGHHYVIHITSSYARVVQLKLAVEPSPHVSFFVAEICTK